MTAEIIGKNGAKKLVVTIDLGAPVASASGKSLVIASSHGNQPTTLTVDGKVVTVGLNAYIRAA